MSFSCACCSKATKVFAKSCCKREGGLLICLDCSTKNYYVACERCREENLEANPDDDDCKDWCDCCDKVRFDLDDEHLYVYIKGKDVIHVCLRCYKDNKEHYDEIEEEYKSDDEEEWCEEHEQVMWKNGMKCGGCLDEQDEKD